MTKYSSIASADIRNYIWEEIKNEGILDQNDYYADGLFESLTPIIPAQQVPEFNNLLPGRTYMLYDFEVKPVPVQWWMTDESFTLTIISQNYETINEISNLINDLFRRYDESANDMNSYLSPDTDFIYHYVSVDSVLSPEPYGSEGDYQIGSITFSYNYSRKIGSNGRF